MLPFILYLQPADNLQKQPLMTATKAQPDHNTLLCGGQMLDLSIPRVMGVLNVTPDSFSDGGELLTAAGHLDLGKALARAEAMCEAGADLLDIGGESTRPGAGQVSAEEEISRVLPLVEAISRQLRVIVSVDTSNPELMRRCADVGAGLINDVRALSRPGAMQAAYASGLPVCLMHMQGTPATMQEAPAYQDPVRDIMAFLRARVDACISAGFSPQRLLVDPGFGFGKTLEHNLQLLGRLQEFRGLKLPLLVGLSRKRMIGTLTGRPEKERMAGSLAAAVIAVMQGASIVRTHDVAECVDALKICHAVIGRQ